MIPRAQDLLCIRPLKHLWTRVRILPLLCIHYILWNLVSCLHNVIIILLLHQQDLLCLTLQISTDIRCRPVLDVRVFDDHTHHINPAYP